MPAFPVLFVCLGNVCRSPFGERLLRLRLRQAGAAAGDFAVTSAGTWASPGTPMHPEMVTRLAALGGSAEGFVSRQVQPPLLEGAGLVLTATREIRSRVLQEAPGALRRTFTVLELAALAPEAPRGEPLGEVLRDVGSRRSTVDPDTADLVDPIGGTPETYDAVAARLDVAVTAITALLVGNAPDGLARGSRIAR